MDEVRIHSGTRVKFKHINESVLPQDFVLRLKELALKGSRVEALFLFAVEPEGQPEQPSLAVAIKTGLFSTKRSEEGFLQIVDEIQLMLPSDLPLNLYRFGASEVLTRYCLRSLEPVFLRSAAWLDKQMKRFKVG